MLRGGAEAPIIQDVLLEMRIKRACGLKLECPGCRGERCLGASEDFKKQGGRLRRAIAAGAAAGAAAGEGPASSATAASEAGLAGGLEGLGLRGGSAGKVATAG